MSSIDFSRFSDWESDQLDVRKMGIERYMLDMTEDCPPVDFLLQYNGVGCIPKCELQAMTGKMKNGKSFACSCLETAMLRESFMGFEAAKENIRILHVDTEQSKATITKRAKTVHTMCDWPLDVNEERYRTLCLRECSSGDRLGKIIEAIEQFNPDFVLIDGIRDLLADFNDPTESSTLINNLTALCNQHKVGIMCVLHENKGDENMRGHLGTELGNKCSEIFKVRKEKGANIITVEQTVCRNEPIGDWAFSLEGGIPKQQNAFYVNPTILKRDNCFKAIFNIEESYTHAELWKAYAELSGLKERSAKKHIADALNDSILHKKGDLYYYGQRFPVESDDEI